MRFGSTYSRNCNVTATNIINKTKYADFARRGKFHISLNLWDFHSIFIQNNIVISPPFIRRSSKKCGIVNVIIFNLHSTANNTFRCFRSFFSLNTFKFVRSLVVRSSEFLARLQPVFKAPNKQLVARSLHVKTYFFNEDVFFCVLRRRIITIAKFCI